MPENLIGPKVAIVFFGLTGSKNAKNGEGEPLHPNLAASYIIPNLIVPNSADCFIHSWSWEQEEALKSLYNPKKYLFEEPDHFMWRLGLKKAGVIWWFRLFVQALLSKRSILKEFNAARNSFSRYLSTTRALGLLEDFCAENSCRYDQVILSRLDVAYYSRIIMGTVLPGQVVVSNWNHVQWQNGESTYNFENLNQDFGFMDLWFGLNYEDVTAFKSVSENFFDYSTNQHKVLFEHLARFGFKPKFMFYRGRDYELVRRVYNGGTS